MRERTSYAVPSASPKDYGDMAIFLSGTMVGFGGSFIERKEDVDGYHARCSISWS